ncbi:prepilin-type N-terminal cleavage/methylation domain-containing protein [Desulfolucanica intricata]|uniref:prepilin-type N-terminal cleavage/methylation domain-containing protein n=1 Tax=Desulfolucanica intricata TaxID=1285191 RepID=UPI00082F95A8|nr:prepilin-type N-terminal cleavage/methylation domain-containing protein [Desulfolucanica intricata]
MIDRRNENGFTLIELMVVIVIIGILIALIIPNMTKQADRAKEKRAIAELTLMKSVIDACYTENGEYPTAINDKNDEIAIISVLGKNGIDWGNLKDPWGRGYKYAFNDAESKYIVYSEGPDSSSDTDYYILASETEKPLAVQEKPEGFDQKEVSSYQETNDNNQS